ncbi:transcriptional regulator domain-containing protein, partial [Pseudomonas aeruginosa]|uniref:transcriptional regulator domain-containing protein n=1 Tax=Pseudomonas aeruginosa TaxID=287 RepID=UPI0021F0E592
MTDRSSQHWYPTAAYLYTLHLDGPALAWEYLRRNPSYRRDWLGEPAEFGKNRTLSRAMCLRASALKRM